MGRARTAAKTWAIEEFGDARLGDTRRVARAVRMATRAAENPAGRISDVFVSAKERDAAYDFLESDHVPPAALIESLGRATARRCVGQEWVRVVLDGSSLTLTDRARD